MQHLAVAETMAGKTFALFLELVAVCLVGCHAGFPTSQEAQALGLATGAGGDCAACLAGDASYCRLISGIFTRPQLPAGYNLIAQIPRGACNINITEMKHSRNYLSLRHTGGGASILNGNWAMDWSGDYPAAGTIFTYHRHDPRGGPKAGESISAPGPTALPVDLLLVVPHQNPNPGIQYQYHVPITPKVAMSGAPVFANLPTGPQKHPTEFESTNRVLQVAPNRGRASPLEAQVGSYHQHRGRKLRPPSRGNMVDHTLPFQPSNLVYQNSAANPSVNGHRFVWRVSEITPCSKTCGGGERRMVMTCVKEASSGPIPTQHAASLQHSSDLSEGAICDPSAPPVETMGRCNIKPCPAEWVTGEWSPCSVSCGEGGIQTRDLWCQQEISPTLRMRVAEGACLTSPSSLPRTRPCPTPSVPCHKRRWITSEWEECSVTCGEGVRKRKIRCSFPGEELNELEDDLESPEDEGTEDECPPEERPPEEESCDMGSCSKDTWFFSEWSSKCSSDCGSGLRTRRIHCSGAGANEIPGSGSCDPSSKPQETMACTSTSSCSDGLSGSWFAGPWSKCTTNAECTEEYRPTVASQTRDVLCISVSEGQFVVVGDRNCSNNLKPITSRPCKRNNPQESNNGEDDYDDLDIWNAEVNNKTISNCNPEWYMTEWSQCSASCGIGHQSREVKCLDRNQQPALGCNPQQRPTIKQECNNKSCGSHPHHHHHSHHQRHQQKHTGTSCKDEFRNCQLVVQARLCHYNYYRNACCFSCGNKS